MFSMWYNMCGTDVSLQKFIKCLQDPALRLKGLAMELSKLSKKDKVLEVTDNEKCDTKNSDYEEVNPSPKIPSIVLIGKTGEGKSKLGNFLLGTNDFEVGDGCESVTEVVKEFEGFLNNNKDMPVRVIDTPGMDDSSGRDQQHLFAIVEHLQKIESINTFIWVMKSTNSRFTASLGDMLRTFQLSFGLNFWNHLYIKVKKAKNTDKFIDKLTKDFDHSKGVDITSKILELDCCSDFATSEQYDKVLLPFYKSLITMGNFDCRGIDAIKTEGTGIKIEFDKLKSENDKLRDTVFQLTGMKHVKYTEANEEDKSIRMKEMPIKSMEQTLYVSKDVTVHQDLPPKQTEHSLTPLELRKDNYMVTFKEIDQENDKSHENNFPSNHPEKQIGNEESIDCDNVPEIPSILTPGNKRKRISPTVDTTGKKFKNDAMLDNETISYDNEAGDDIMLDEIQMVPTSLENNDNKIYQNLEIDSETNIPVVQIHKHLYNVLQPHQARGVHFMWKSCFGSIKQVSESDGSGAILAHCMGLGKSLQAITLIHTILSNSKTGMKNALILCPVSTIRSWENEFHTWLETIPSFKIFTLRDTNKIVGRCQVLSDWKNMGGVLIMGYDQFRSLNSGKRSTEVKTRLNECLLDPGPDIVFCDEGHLLKNEKASITKEIHKIRSKRRIILTGAPFQNNLNEYFTMVNFIKPGLLGSENEFRTKFAIPIEKGLHKDSNIKDVQVMKERSFILCDLLKDHMQILDHDILAPFLPAKHEYVISVMLTPVQKKLYKYYIENKSSYKSNKPSLLKDVRNLAKIWNHPALMVSHVANMLETEYQNSVQADVPIHLDECNKFLGENNTWEDVELSSKIRILMGILKKSKNKGDKVLVFSQSLQTIDIIEKFLVSDTTDVWEPCKNYYRLDGNTTLEDRKRMIKYFNMVGNPMMRLFLVSTKAGGLGINLPAANRVVIFDVSWNPSNDLQSIYRVYRLGQAKPVYIYRLMAKGTMEEKIYDRQVSKLSLSARIIDEHQIDRHFKNDEQKSLYEFKDYKKEDKPTPKVPKDDILEDILLEFEDLIWNYHDHDSLLENKVDEVLSEEDQKQAWISFREHQKLLLEQTKLRQLLTKKVQLATFQTWLTTPKKKVQKSKMVTKFTEDDESTLIVEDENSTGFVAISSSENSLSSQASILTSNPTLHRRTSQRGDEWEKCNWSGCLQWTDPSDFTVHQLRCSITKKALEFSALSFDTLPQTLEMKFLPRRVTKKLVLDYSEISTVVIQSEDLEESKVLANALSDKFAGCITTGSNATVDKELLMLVVKRTEYNSDLFIGFVPYNKEKGKEVLEQELHLAINPTGCARTEPKLSNHFKTLLVRNLAVKKVHNFKRTADGASKDNLDQVAKDMVSTLIGLEAIGDGPYSKNFVQSKSSQYRQMKQDWRQNVVLARSKRAGLGLYAARDLDKGQMIIEYIGEIIRFELTDIRVKKYEASNHGIYMFRLDDDRVVDATMSGGVARYINHSCDPNCVTETVEVNGDWHIIIFAIKKILRGEELSYDYKIDYDDDSNRIPCACDSASCRKWMNSGRSQGNLYKKWVH